MKEHSNLSSNLTLVDNPSLFLYITDTLHIYALPVLIALGIPGNLLSFIVFTCSTAMKKLPSSTYMAALALSDSGFLSILLCTWLQNMRIQIYITQSWCQFIVFGSYIFGFLSVWFTVLFTIERYKVVCYPLKATQICTKRRARLSTLIICIITVFLYMPSFWTTTIDNREQCMYRQKLFVLLAVITYMDTAITFILPFLALLFMNIRIIWAVRAVKKRMNWLQESQPHEKTQNLLSKTQMKLTKSLVIVSSVFVVMVLPSHITRFYSIIFTNFLSYDVRALQEAQHFLLIPYYLTFGINLILYAGTNHMFRRGFLEIYHNIKEKIQRIIPT